MIELLTDFDREQTSLKKVTIDLSQNPLIPFSTQYENSLFIKQRLNFDKYELQKIIPWEEFDRLFRPFKEEKELKDYVKYANLSRKYFICNILSIILFVIILSIICRRQCLDSLDEVVFFTVFGLFIVYALTPIFLSCYQMSLRSKCYAKLQQYCLNLSNNNRHVSIIAKQKQAVFSDPIIKKVDDCLLKCLVATKSYVIEVQSRTMKEDMSMVKLYLKRKSIFFHYSCSLDKPIFSKLSFDYDHQRIKGIKDFESIQAKIRPIKGSQIYKKYSKWWKIFIISSILSIVLMALPAIIFPRKKQNQRLVIGLVYGIGFFVGTVLSLIILYVTKLNGLITVEMNEYCEKISVVDKQVDITIHIEEQNETKRCCADVYKNQLYCIEVRKKISNQLN